MIPQDPFVRITTQNFTGPHKAEVVTTDYIYALRPSTMTLTQEELEVKLSNLLAQAANSGFDVEITKHSNPAKGLGGYMPHIITRPSFDAVRAKMAEAAALDAHMQQHGAHGFIPGDE